MSRLTVNVDGGARGNPGPAAIGVVVRDGDEVLEEVGETIGEATNNVAEYKALLRGIELAAAHGASELELIGDSELVVRQVEGSYKVKNAGIKPLHEEAVRALGGFHSWSIRHVPRAQNADADRLVNEALDGTSGGGASPGAEPEGERSWRPIDPGVDIGHVHLKVADVDRALDFYCGILGFELMQRYGADAAFISAGGYHHHIGLNSWQSKGAAPPPPGTTGLFHAAIRYPTRRALADALRRLSEAHWPLEGASDHGVSEALYLSDPDRNGVELYWDRPRERWPTEPDGEGLAMFTQPLDLDSLLAELRD